MPRIVREAEIDWEGTTARGSGVVRALSTGSFELSSTIASRVDIVEGKTSPEELLAAAHATCFVTSLGSELARLGAPPERMHVRCTITMDEVEGSGHRIVALAHLRVGSRTGSGRRDVHRCRGGCRRGLPVLGADQGERYRHRRRDTRGGNVDGRSHRTRHLVGLAHGGRRDDHERGERRLRAARRHLGLARRGVGRPDEPGGAHRRSARSLLLDGALARPRPGRHAARQARRRRDRDLRSRDGHHEDRARRSERSVPGLDEPAFLHAARGREGGLPGLEGARRRSRDHARTRASPSRSVPSGDGDRAPRRRAGPLLRGGAGATVRSRGLQRPPPGCGRRQEAEGARDSEEAGRRVATGT